MTELKLYRPYKPLDSYKEMAVQMFRDLYLTKFQSEYGECYYLKSFGMKGAYLNIEDTDIILSKLPTEKLDIHILLAEYNRLQRLKKRRYMNTKELLCVYNFFGD
jgi:hypothetical protein